MDSKTRARYENFLGRLASEQDMFETAIEEGISKAEKELKPIIEQKNIELENKNIALINSAKTMLQANISIEQVQEITKLQIEQIRKLKEDI